MDDDTLREAIRILRESIRRSVAHAEPKKDLIDRIEQLEAKLAKAVDALDEAVYLLRPDEKDMMRQAGVYRIVTALAELKGL